MKGDLGKAWSQLNGRMWVFHRCFRGERTSQGIIFRDKPYLSIQAFQEAVDDYIREGEIIIQNSIKDNNNG